MLQDRGGGSRHFVARIVSADRLEEERAVARMFRAIGIMREAFSDPAEARRWESEQASLWRYGPPLPPAQSD